MNPHDARSRGLALALAIGLLPSVGCDGGPSMEADDQGSEVDDGDDTLVVRESMRLGDGSLTASQVVIGTEAGFAFAWEAWVDDAVMVEQAWLEDGALARAEPMIDAGAPRIATNVFGDGLSTVHSPWTDPVAELRIPGVEDPVLFGLPLESGTRYALVPSGENWLAIACSPGYDSLEVQPVRWDGALLEPVSHDLGSITCAGVEGTTGGGDAWVVVGSSFERAVLVRLRSDGRTAWPPIGLGYFEYRIAASDTHVHLLWAEQGESTSEVFVRSFAIDGSEALPPTMIAEGHGPMALAAHGGRFFAAWTEDQSLWLGGFEAATQEPVEEPVIIASAPETQVYEVVAAAREGSVVLMDLRYDEQDDALWLTELSYRDATNDEPS